MLVQLAPGIGEITISEGAQFLSITKGEQLQLFEPLLSRLLSQGQVVKCDYPEILNNQVATLAYDSKDRNWRPIFKLEKR